MKGGSKGERTRDREGNRSQSGDGGSMREKWGLEAGV